MKPSLPQAKSVDKEEPKNGSKREDFRFLIISTFGELLDLAMHLSQTYDVLFHVPESKYKKIGDGLVQKIDDWHPYMGQDYIFVIDGTENAGLQDWLREQGEYVVGTNAAMSEYENNRQLGQAWFRELGFEQPESKNFKDFDSAIEHVKNSKTRLILKQNGDLPKSLNHMGKFDDGHDMLYHLDKLKKSWNEAQHGKVDFDLMEVVEGQEIAASAFFNGDDWLRDEEGKVVGFLNFEQKKETDGDMGETTGEMGTIFLGVDEDNETFEDILLRDGITEKLRETGYRGVFDINGALTDNGFVGFEPTSRFGVPATSYEFLEGLKSDTGELLAAMAMGDDGPIRIQKGWGIVQVVAAKPFPVDADIENESTSLGERLWPLKDGKRVDDFTKEQMRHIHLQNFEKKDGAYLVATMNGYLLTITQTGDDIDDVREKAIEYIKNNLFISGMKYRQDLGYNISYES